MRTEEEIREQLRREKEEADAHTDAEPWYRSRIALLEWILS